MAEITRHRPFTPMRNLRREIDRLFGEFLPFFGEEGDGDLFTAVWTPRMDLSETDEEFIVRMDLPGLKKDEVTVNVEDNRLTVSGERKEEKKEESENYLRMERSYGSFYRSVRLPKTAQVEAVKAEFTDGVLRVHVPKAEEHKPHKVEIT
jgi:HSP20 family protein